MLVRFLRFCLLVCVLVLLSVPAAHAEEPVQRGPGLSYWAYAGPSVTTLGAGGSAGLGVEFGGNVLSLRAVSTDPTFGRETWDVALLYGRAFRHENFFFSAGAGVAVAGGMRYNGFFGEGTAEEMDTQMGFPLEGMALWTPLPVAGIGLHGYANVNTGHPFGGIGLVLRVGKLR